MFSLVTIPWAGPLSLMEFHSIDNGEYMNISILFCEALFVEFYVLVRSQNVCWKNIGTDRDVTLVLYY